MKTGGRKRRRAKSFSEQQVFKKALVCVTFSFSVHLVLSFFFTVTCREASSELIVYTTPAGYPDACHRN